jgi:hypothetical protein
LMTANLSDGAVAWHEPAGERLFSLTGTTTASELPAWGLVLTLQPPA